MNIDDIPEPFLPKPIRNMYFILDDDNEAVEVLHCLKWGKWMEKNRDRKVVKRDKVGDLTVSTVFLGLNHEWGDGPPLIFETMVFRGFESEDMEAFESLDDYTRRYSSYQDAELGHSLVKMEVMDEISIRETEEKMEKGGLIMYIKAKCRMILDWKSYVGIGRLRMK